MIILIRSDISVARVNHKSGQTSGVWIAKALIASGAISFWKGCDEGHHLNLGSGGFRRYEKAVQKEGIGYAKARVRNGIVQCFPALRVPSPVKHREEQGLVNHGHIVSLLV